MTLYFLGICGTAMGNAALLGRAAGHTVLGADTGIYPPMSNVLAEAGITILEGYDADRLARLSPAPDLVVIGNAMSRGNPEVEYILDNQQSLPPRRLAFTSLPALLHSTILSGRRNIVIAGTHGKTTTTSLTAHLLRCAGRDPGYLIGGVPLDPPTGNHLGNSEDPFVIEGDEYDSAFFDKRSKFIHYAPHIAVLNNLEFDHADIFRDLADVQRTFSHFARIVPRNGFVVLNGDDENLRALGPLPWTRVIRVGTGDGNDVRITNFSESPEGARFHLLWRGASWGEGREVVWKIPGIYNARNAAMAATAAGLALHPENPSNLEIASALARFRGVKRRQEILVSTTALTVIEDFGHHPTALAETLHSLRNRYPGTTLTAVFEPRSNTARTRALQAGFTDALALADEVYLGTVNRADKLSPDERFDSPAVIRELTARGVSAQTAASNAGLLDALLASQKASSAAPNNQPRLVVFFSNGSFDGIIARFAAAAK